MSSPFDVDKRARVSLMCKSRYALSFIGVSGSKHSGGCLFTMKSPAISLRTAAFLVLFVTASWSLQITAENTGQKGSNGEIPRHRVGAYLYSQNMVSYLNMLAYFAQHVAFIGHCVQICRHYNKYC
jgi:hypothetical protein